MTNLLRPIPAAAAAAFVLAGCASAPRPVMLDPAQIELSIVAEDAGLWTGVAVSARERIFLNYPRWSDAVEVSVVELMPDGRLVPYPPGDWNTWTGSEDPAERFVCVQSVHVDAKDRLWILDPANPSFGGVVAGGPKLVEVDLRRDKVVRVIPVPGEVAPRDSYLNDIRVDVDREVAYITDSGIGAIVVVDLETGASRRLLDRHESTLSEDIVLTIGGREWLLPDGSRPQVHADGLALSPDNAWLYYQALTARSLYRIPTAYLLADLPAAEVEAAVEFVVESGASDAIISDPWGNIYLTSLEHDAIRRVTPGGRVETIVQSPRISWPDSFAWGPDGSLYFTTAQIHEGPNPPAPYRLWKIAPVRLF